MLLRTYVNIIQCYQMLPQPALAVQTCTLSSYCSCLKLCNLRSANNSCLKWFYNTLKYQQSDYHHIAQTLTPSQGPAAARTGPGKVSAVTVCKFSTTTTTASASIPSHMSGRQQPEQNHPDPTKLNRTETGSGVVSAEKLLGLSEIGLGKRQCCTHKAIYILG